MNHIMIAGHLAKDPEERFTGDGTKVTTLVIPTNSRKGGQEETTWWRVTVWGDRYAKMMPYFTKGKPIIVTGEMSKPQIYTDKSGNPQLSSIDVRAETISFSPFGRPEGSEGSAQQASNSGKQEMSAGQANVATSAPTEDENLPF